MLSDKLIETQKLLQKLLPTADGRAVFIKYFCKPLKISFANENKSFNGAVATPPEIAGMLAILNATLAKFDGSESYDKAEVDALADRMKIEAGWAIPNAELKALADWIREFPNGDKT